MHKKKNKETAKMKRQRNIAQMKEQIKTPEKELNKMEVEFRCRVQNTGYKDAQGTQ